MFQFYFVIPTQTFSIFKNPFSQLVAKLSCHHCHGGRKELIDVNLLKTSVNKTIRNYLFRDVQIELVTPHLYSIIV